MDECLSIILSVFHITNKYHNGIGSESDVNKLTDYIINKYKNDSNGMKLDRHDIDLTGKNVILSEDVITKATTAKKMIDIVQQWWGTVVAITCQANRTWDDNIDGIPLFTSYTPAPFELYYDENTPEAAIGNNPKIPDNAKKVEKPKASWNDLVQSMR